MRTFPLELRDCCESSQVYDGSIKGNQPFSLDIENPWRFDVSKLLKGAIEVEVKYWMESLVEPTLYEQIGRTLDARRRAKRPMEFVATSGGRLESMRQYATVPASFQPPFLSFRVMAKVIEQNQD